MFNLLSVEFYKLCRKKAVYIAAAFMICFGALLSFDFFAARPLADMEMALYAISDTSLVFIITLVVAAYVGSDFADRTIHNSIKLGYSRGQIVLSKMIPAMVLSALLQLCYGLVTVIPVGIRYGFSTTLPLGTIVLWWAVCLVQCCAAESFIVLIAFLVRNQTMAMAVGTCFTLVTCNILRNFMSQRIFEISCFYFAQDYSTNNLLTVLAAAAVVLLCTAAASCVGFRKAEIK